MGLLLICPRVSSLIFLDQAVALPLSSPPFGVPALREEAIE
jgi:hypothetical protein